MTPDDDAFPPIRFDHIDLAVLPDGTLWDSDLGPMPPHPDGWFSVGATPDERQRMIEAFQRWSAKHGVHEEDA